MARTYYTIYGEVLRMKELGSTDKLIFMVISNYTRLKSGVCSASASSIAKQAGVGLTAAKKSMAKLLKIGLIKSMGKTDDSKHINIFSVDSKYLVVSDRSRPEPDYPKETIRSNRYETEVIATNTPTPEMEKQVVRKEALVEQLIPKKSESKYDHFKYNKNLTAEEKESIDTNYSYWPVRIAEQIPRVFELPTTIQKEIRSDIIETQRNINEIVEYLKKKVDAFIKPLDPGW